MPPDPRDSSSSATRSDSGTLSRSGLRLLFASSSRVPAGRSATPLNDYLCRNAPPGGISRNEFNIANRVARHLGAIPLHELRAADIERWLSTALAEPAQIKRSEDLHPLERVRRRKATLNRQLALLRAALTLAFVNRRIDSDVEWRRVAYFRNAQPPAPQPVSPEAIELLRSNALPDPLQLIARQLGHKWLRTTEHYYVGIDREIADDAIRKVLSEI